MFYGIAFEIEFDEHGWFVANDATVVSGFDGDDLRRDEVFLAAVLEFDLHVAMSEEPDMRVHAPTCSGDWFHILFPMKARRIDDAFDAPTAHPQDRGPGGGTP